MKNGVSVKEFSDNIEHYLERVRSKEGELLLLNNGKPVAVVMSAEDYHAIQERISQSKAALRVD